MAKHNNIGKDGETIARRYLEQKDYLILETNWRKGHLEADIIAYKDNQIIFVEVKTRSTDIFGAPEEFVDLKKQKAYMHSPVIQHIPQKLFPHMSVQGQLHQCSFKGEVILWTDRISPFSPIFTS